MPRRSDARFAGWLDLTLAVCVLAAFAQRTISISHIPGINGDEAYLGTKVLLFLRGGAISLQTGSALPPDPLSFLFSVLAHSALPIDFATLRAPSALSGILAVVASYGLFRRVYGESAARLISVLVACLPTHIVYSRFFWEPSQTPLIVVVCLYLALSRRPVWTALAFAVALVVHPSNVFLAPILAVFFSSGLKGRLRSLLSELRERQWRAVLLLVSLLLLFGGLVSLLLPFIHWDRLTHQLALRISHGDQLWAFMRGHAALFDGSTVYAYVAGAPLPSAFSPSRIAFLLIFWLPVGVALWWSRDRELKLLALGTLTSLVLFYLLVGSRALEPNLERYAIWMTVPHCVLLGLSLDRLATLLETPPLAKVVVLFLAIALLVSVHESYFQRLRSADVRTEKAFLTGDVDPKQKALERILARRDPERSLRILTEDWWTYWAIKYLSLAEPDIEVSIQGSQWDSRFPHDFILSPASRQRTQIFFLGYSGGRLSQLVRERHPEFERMTIEGYPAQPILDVYSADPPD